MPGAATSARGGATPRTRPLVHTTGDRHTQRPCRAHEVTFFCVTTWFPRARGGPIGSGSRRARCTVVHVYSAGRRPTRRLVVLVVAARPLRVPVRGMVRVRERDSTRRHTSPVVKDRMRSVARHARSSGSAGWGGAAGSLTKQRRLGGTGGGGEARRRGGDGTARGFPPRSRQTHTKRKATLLVPWPLQPSTLLLGAHERK